MKEHHYLTKIEWKGNKGQGTIAADKYSRDHELTVKGKEIIQCSSDPAFRGDPSLYNPEDFLLASVSACHMLWYLHLCADNSVIVTEYTDRAEGIMKEEGMKGGRFESITLKPLIKLSDRSMEAKARSLHEEANKLCFISNSLNFTVDHEPEFVY